MTIIVITRDNQLLLAVRLRSLSITLSVIHQHQFALVLVGQRIDISGCLRRLSVIFTIPFPLLFLVSLMPQENVL